MAATIELQGYRILKIDFEFLGYNDEEKDIIDNLKSSTVKIGEPLEFSTSEDYSNGRIILGITAIDKPNYRKIILHIEGQFLINKSALDNDIEKIQQNLSINGTAILLPYARAITSMISTLDSPSAIVLPTVNVFDLLKNIQNHEISNDTLDEITKD